MPAIALFALLFFASKAKSASSSPQLKGPRRKVQGKSKTTWYVAQSTGFFGADQTKMQIYSVFASETGNELVIAYCTFPEAVIKAAGTALFGEDGSSKVKDVRALFYASPSSLTKNAVADFIG